MFDGKKVLITGGTGSLGKALTKKLLETDVDTIRIFSRDEWKQVQMQAEFNDERFHVDGGGTEHYTISMIKTITYYLKSELIKFKIYDNP